MKVKELLKDIRKRNIDIAVSGDDLQIKSADTAVPQDLFEEIRKNKEDIISYLRKNRADATEPSPIPLAAGGPYFPLSSSQKRLWILSQLEDVNLAYNMSEYFFFEGRMDVAAMQLSLRALMERHETLRTVFREDEKGEVWQLILSPGDTGFRLDHRDLRHAQAVDEVLNEKVWYEFTTPFDLSTGPLWRVGLYQVDDGKWFFSYTMHHIICDGWSMSVLFKELLQYYHAFVEGYNKDLPPLRIQYKDYAAWQLQQLSGGKAEHDKTWWLARFSGALPVLELPGSKARPAIKTYRGALVRKNIDSSTARAMKALVKGQGCTLFMGLLAAITALLHRYTGLCDIIIGAPIAGREHADLEGQIGFYVNTLALRVQFNDDVSYNDLLGEVRRTTLGAYEHQRYPFDELVEALKLERDMSRNPLFDIGIMVQSVEATAGYQGSFDGLKVSSYTGQQQRHGIFDILFQFLESGDELFLDITFNSDIYEESTIQRLSCHLERLMASMTAHPGEPVRRMDYLSDEEKHQLLVTFNDTATAFPADSTVADLFEEQVRRTPGHTALVFEEVRLTYSELNEKANRLAGYLQGRYGVGPNDLVAVRLPRSEWIIIAILAILKSGGAYVPLDTAYPEEQVNYMLEDSNSKVLIDEAGLKKFIDEEGQYTSQDRPSKRKVSDLAYVMYTSGSMGRPKGVMIEHAAIIRLVRSNGYVELGEDEVLLSTGALSFDATTFEYWGMLLNGGRLILCSQGSLLDTTSLAALIKDQGVTMMWFTAGWLDQLIDTDIGIFHGLKTVLAGGDKLSLVHIQALRSRYPELVIINGYGPTENTTFSLTYRMGASITHIPIGKPINNSTAYILDRNRQLLPIGAAGEICVGGAGLARGYLNNPALTAEKFIPDPFHADQRLYRTGDLGYWLPDGDIFFLGRLDDQVKVRGYRIELGEIERVLSGFDGIDSAVVIARTGAAGAKELAAYMVGREMIDKSEVRARLGKILPGYMVPAHFIQLGTLPLTVNGKVDRRQLPDPADDDTGSSTSYLAPENDIEMKLVLIWKELLGKDKIGVLDNFFEVGGNSINIIRLSRLVSEALQREIKVTTLFQYPNIRDLVEAVMQERPAAKEDDLDRSELMNDLNKFNL